MNQKENLKNQKTMSQKSKINRARREANQEKEGKKVMEWLIGALVVLFIVVLVASMMLQ